MYSYCSLYNSSQNMSFTAELGTMGSFKKDTRCNPFQLAKFYNRTANTGSLRCDWTWSKLCTLLSIYFVKGAYL